MNTTGATGYNGIPSNVQRVQYSAANVYITCAGVPGYAIGPPSGHVVVKEPVTTYLVMATFVVAGLRVCFLTPVAAPSPSHPKAA